MKTTRHFWSYLAQFFLEWEMLQTKVVEEIKTHFLCSVTFFPPKSAVYEIMVEKYCRVGQATDDNMVHLLYMLDNYCYTHTHTQNM
jgi:hypothetical protein